MLFLFGVMWEGGEEEGGVGKEKEGEKEREGDDRRKEVVKLC